jgi:hypothetical protein
VEFLFKVAYYGAASISGFVIAGLFLANLFGNAAGETWRNKAILIVSAASGMALLYLSFRMGHQQGQWLAGVGLAALALVVAGLLMFGGLLVFTKVNWQ